MATKSKNDVSVQTINNSTEHHEDDDFTEFESKLRGLDKKITKASKPKESKKIIVEFSSLVRNIRNSNENTKKLETAVYYFESKICILLYHLNDEWLNICTWANMLEIFLDLKMYYELRKYRKKALKSVFKVLTADHQFANRTYQKARISFVTDLVKGKYWVSLMPRYKSWLAFDVIQIDPTFEHDYCEAMVKVIHSRFSLVLKEGLVPSMLEKLYVWKGRMLLEMKDYTKAIKAFKHALEQITIQAILGRSNYDLRREYIYYQAAQCYKCLNSERNEEKALLKCISSRNPRYDGATISDEKGANSKPDWINLARFELGDMYFERNEINKASEQYQNALESIAKSVLNMDGDLSYSIDHNTYSRSMLQTSKDRLENFYFERKSDKVDLSVQDKLKVSNIESLINDQVSKGTDSDAELILDLLDICEIWLLNFLKEKFFVFRVPEPYKIRSDIHLELGNYYEALEDMKKYNALTLDHDFDSKLQQVKTISSIQNRLGLHSDTIDMAFKAISDLETSGSTERVVPYYLILLKTYLKLGNYGLANGTAKKIDQYLCCWDADHWNSFSNETCKLLGRSYHEVGLYKHAIDYFDMGLGNEYSNCLNLYKARSLIMLERHLEAQDLLLNCKFGMKCLILLIINTVILDKPHKNHIKNVFKICQESVKPLRDSIWICPDKYLSLFLELLELESKFEEKYKMFKQSLMLSNHFRLK